MPDVRDAPALRAPRAGLLLAAQTLNTVSTPEGAGESRWGRGVEWEPEAHPTTSEAYGARALTCAPNAAIALGADDKPIVEDAYPFQVYAFDWCSSLDQSRDWEGRARRLLEYTQSASIAAEFWTGVISQATAANNVWLARTGAVAIAGGPYDVPHAIAQMDQRLSVELTNSPGAMHMSPLVFSLSTLNGHVRKDGDVWVSPMGHIVIGDAGYTGIHADAPGAQSIIGTTIPEIVLGPIRVTPPTEGFAWDVNTMVAWAQRDVLVMHEPSRAHLRVGVTP